MRVADLKPFSPLYRTGNVMGSANLLRSYLNLQPDFPVPLSIAHGVDLNHLTHPQDVYAIEPIHWAYNEDIFYRSKKVKPSIRTPHPWIILEREFEKKQKGGAGTLVVAPPPGKKNDVNLLNCLRSARIKTGSILLKYRGPIDSSKLFWEYEGFEVVTAGHRDEMFYCRLFQLLAKYDHVVSGTLSSALVFAGALGKRVSILNTYRYTAYDAAIIYDICDYAAIKPKQFISLIEAGDVQAVSDFSLRLLGAEFYSQKSDIRDQLQRAIDRLDYPVFFAEPFSSLNKKIRLIAFKRLGSEGIITKPIFKIFKDRLSQRVSWNEMNEIDMWKNGVNSNNFRQQLVPYIKGLREPGWAE